MIFTMYTNMLIPQVCLKHANKYTSKYLKSLVEVKCYQKNFTCLLQKYLQGK